MGDSSPCRVLVVEDHSDTCDLMVRLLRGRYDVVTADCYEEALRVAESGPPDIVITDVGLPGRSGLELMRELKARYGVPGVAVTGHVIEDGPEYRDAGFVKFLRKPIRVEELLKVLTEACAEAAA
jgi:CheY-like chemotaxis protein